MRCGKESDYKMFIPYLLKIHISPTVSANSEIIWRDTDRDLLQILAGSQADEGLPEFIEWKQPDCRMKKELKVMSLCQILAGSLNECATYLLQWT